MLPKKGVEKSAFAPADPRQCWLCETKQDRVWFIHLLRHIWTAAMSYSSCWARPCIAPEWSSIIQVFHSLFRSRRPRVREFHKVMHQRAAAVCAGWAWHRLQRWEGNREAFAMEVASDFFIVGGCPFRSLGRRWSHRAATPAARVGGKKRAPACTASPAPFISLKSTSEERSQVKNTEGEGFNM